MKTPGCPNCGRTLYKVTRPKSSVLNDDQFDAIRAGDWYCTNCTGFQSNTGYRYWWRWEVKEHQKTPGCPVRGPEGLCSMNHSTDVSEFRSPHHQPEDNSAAATPCPGYREAEPGPHCERRKGERRVLWPRHCPFCNGGGKLFSHPINDRGDTIQIDCSGCSGTGLVYLEMKPLKLLSSPNRRTGTDRRNGKGRE